MKTPLLKINQTSVENGLCALASVLLGIWCYQHLVQGIYEATDFNGFIANGPFQLYNPLRRLAAGQIAGQDFQFFHGLGVPFLYYPLFYLFGKTFYASELSRHFTSLICFLVSLFAFSIVLTKANLKRTFIISATIVYLLVFISPDGTSPLNLLAIPGNSLLGVRATFPLLTFAVLLSDIRRVIKAVLVGLCFALTLVCGTEHGLALVITIFAVGLLTLAVTNLRRDPNTAKVEFDSPIFYALTLLSFFLSLCLIYLLLSTPPGFIAALRYNLGSVPADQYWYFGVPPNEFVGSLLDLKGLGLRNCLVLITVFIGFCLLWWKLAMAQAKDRKLAFTVCWMLGYGAISCLSCLGILTKGYLAPAFRISIFALCLWLYRANTLQILHAYIKTRLPRFRLPIEAGCVLLALVWITGAVLMSLQSLPPMSTKLWELPPQHLSVNWQKHLQQATAAIDAQRSSRQAPKIWSLYAGLLEDHYGVFHPREDYIIHALGPERRDAYLQSLQTTQPEIVQTIRKSYFYHYAYYKNYEQGLRNSSWDFYEEILNNYEILTVTDRAIFWRRKTAAWQPRSNDYQSVAIHPNMSEVELPIDPPQTTPEIYVVRVQYKTNNPWQRVPLVGGLPRFLIDSENTFDDLPISLPPYLQEFCFHVVTKPGCKPKLRFQVSSLLPAASLQITGVAVKPLPLTDRVREAFLD